MTARPAADQPLQLIHALPGRLRLRLRGPLCKAEPAALVAAAMAVAGVRQARVNRRAGSLVVVYDRAALDPQGLIGALSAGLSGPLRGQAAQVDGVLGEVLSALAVLGGTHLLPQGAQLPVSAAASVPVLRHALADLRKNGVTSHVLEALAVSISLLRSDYTAANATAFMLALGEYLEQSIARRSDDLLKNLLRPASNLVWVLRDGAEIQIPAEAVALGDHVVVAAGTVVPIDGTVLSGSGTVNEAAMTGESVPVVKGRGDPLLSGTVVEEGRLVVYAEQVGGQTAAARIAAYVEQSLTAKSSAQIQAAQLADQLVPSVLKLAAASLVLTGDWRASASVLQADYSCALKLATPVTFKAAMFQAGRSGILVKGATALERLASADTVLFDKTGTLTTGRLEVTDSIAFEPGMGPDDLLSLAASVEEHYFHPLALAVVNAARSLQDHHFDHSEVQFIVAHGVASEIDGQRVVVGSRHFIEDDEGISLAAHRQVIDRLYGEGKTLLFIGYGGRLLGILGLRDTIRANAAATIARLRRAGVRRIVLLTGDHQDRARELANTLGLDEVHAGLLPDDKARIISELGAAGAKIAFVGDGINDAPALAGAQVGIAMQKGADIARLTADIALLEDDIERVADAKDLANAAMGRIDRNYRLTVGLNSIILGLAAFGKLSPVAAAVLHNGTTIGILLNALRRFSGKAVR
jgi:heavy metal translocating P-type ATPase